MAARGWLALGVALWVAAPACTTDHDALAKPPKAGAGGTTAGVPGVGGGGRSAQAGRGGGGAAGRPIDEPPGENVLTLIHGVVDAPELRLCFLAGSGEAARVVEIGEAATLLRFGEHLVIRELDGVDWAEDTLQPIAVVGELDRVAELGCEAAIAVAREEQAAAEPPPRPVPASGEAGSGGASGTGGVSGAPPEAGAFSEGGAAGATEPIDPPVLRVGELPMLPAGTLTRGRSLLFVANGCVGGAAFVGKNAVRACGSGYSGTRSTLGAVLVPMSRKMRFDGLGLQVVHASRATGPIGLHAAPDPLGTESPATIANEVTPGAIEPIPARVEQPASLFGVDSPSWGVEALAAGVPIFRESWASVLERGGLTRIADGSTYAIVVLGPALDLRARGFWNAPAFSIVATDPTEPAE